MTTGRVLYYTLNFTILFFILAPIAIIFVFAFDPTMYITFPPQGFSLRWFVAFFSSAPFMAALWLSFQVAVITTILSTLIGALASIALARGNLPGAKLITAFVLSPLMLPAILTGLSLFQAYMFIDVGRPLWGLVAGHVLVTTPYVIRTTLAVLHNFDGRLEEAATSLGANPLRVYWEVTLPLIKPGVIAGSIFAFIVSFDQVPVSMFLVAPGSETLPITLFNFMKFEMDGRIAAASVVSIAISFAIVLGIERTVGLRSYGKM